MSTAHPERPPPRTDTEPFRPRAVPACAPLQWPPAPFRAATTELTVGLVWSLLEAVEWQGFPAADFARSAGLDLGALRDATQRVPLAHVYRLCEHALERTGEPALGLHWQALLGERHCAPLGALVSHAQSLRHALALIGTFAPLVSSAVPFSVEEGAELVTLRTLGQAPSARLARLESELVLATLFRAARFCRGTPPPERVCFAYPAPSYTAEYQRVFRGLQRFDQPFTGIVLRRAALDAPWHQDERSYRELHDLATQRLGALARHTAYWARAYVHLVQAGFPAHNDMASVARALGMSVRSLRSHLGAEGRSFHVILREAQVAVVSRLLSDPDRTLEDVAEAMGFADRSAFHRAFKRWTGSTPAAFRRAH